MSNHISTQLSRHGPQASSLLALALLIVVAPVTLVGWLCFLVWLAVWIVSRV